MFSISVKEIQENFEDKTRRRLEIYRKLLEKCFLTIKHHSNGDHTFCFFEVPPVKLGLPIYKVDQCLTYIEMKLKEKGFKVKKISETILYISWPLKAPDYRRLEYLTPATPTLALDAPPLQLEDEPRKRPSTALSWREVDEQTTVPAVPSLLRSAPVNIPFRLPRDTQPQSQQQPKARIKNVMRNSTPLW